MKKPKLIFAGSGGAIVLWFIGSCAVIFAQCVLASEGAAYLNKREKVSEAQHLAQLNLRGWELVAADEFDGEHINTDIWSFEVNCSGGGNNEQQCYTDRPDNFKVQGGMLHLIAKEEQYSGSPFFDDDANYRKEDKSKTLPFTSARVRSKHKLDFKYGRVEVRAKIAGGKGMWPAIWMLPSENVYGAWPRSGEIDIMEAVNAGVGANEIHGTLHYGLPWPQWENHGRTIKLDNNPADQFHVYAIEWEADEIRWYLDGQHYQTQRSEGWYNYIWKGQDLGFQVANQRAPFDQEFHIVMNVAVGGDWPGAPDREWQDPRSMQVDYVRVFQCRPNAKIVGAEEEKEDDGSGCATVADNVPLNQDIGRPLIKKIPLYSSGQTELSPVESAGLARFQVKKSPSQAKSAQAEGGTDLDDRAIHASFVQSGVVTISPQIKSSSDNSQPLTLELFGGAGWAKSGAISFDMLVLDATPDSQFEVEMSGLSGKGAVTITAPQPGHWQTVYVSLPDLIEDSKIHKGELDVSRISEPFALKYKGKAASFKLDNVVLLCAQNSEPEEWQGDKVCGLRTGLTGQ